MFLCQFVSAESYIPKKVKHVLSLSTPFLISLIQDQIFMQRHILYIREKSVYLALLLCPCFMLEREMIMGIHNKLEDICKRVWLLSRTISSPCIKAKKPSVQCFFHKKNLFWSTIVKILNFTIFPCIRLKFRLEKYRIWRKYRVSTFIRWIILDWDSNNPCKWWYMSWIEWKDIYTFMYEEKCEDDDLNI